MCNFIKLFLYFLLLSACIDLSARLLLAISLLLVRCHTILNLNRSTRNIPTRNKRTKHTKDQVARESPRRTKFCVPHFPVPPNERMTESKNDPRGMIHFVGSPGRVFCSSHNWRPATIPPRKESKTIPAPYIRVLTPFSHPKEAESAPRPMRK